MENWKWFWQLWDRLYIDKLTAHTGSKDHWKTYQKLLNVHHKGEKMYFPDIKRLIEDDMELNGDDIRVRSFAVNISLFHIFQPLKWLGESLRHGAVLHYYLFSHTLSTSLGLQQKVRP